MIDDEYRKMCREMLGWLDEGGWTLVPKEATDEIVLASKCAPERMSLDDMRAAYANMVARGSALTQIDAMFAKRLN